MVMTDFPAELVQAFVTMSNKVQKQLSGMSGEDAFQTIKDIVENADVVFALWQDESEPNGVGVLMIKGDPNLLEIIASGRATCKIAAIPCTERAHAEAARASLGNKLN
jgi:hypothetical protein